MYVTLASRQLTHCSSPFHAGVLAYLGFGGYLGLGETLWNQPLNYYLIPVIVSGLLIFIYIHKKNNKIMYLQQKSD